MALKAQKLRAEADQAEAEFRASLPFLGDDIFVLIAAELDARMLGRLISYLRACSSRPDAAADVAAELRCCRCSALSGVLLDELEVEQEKVAGNEQRMNHIN